MTETILSFTSSWEYFKACSKPVLIYGMGNGADMVIDELTKLNVSICGVTCSDDFVRGQVFRGYKVKKLSDFTEDFVIAVCFGSSIKEVMNHIYLLNEGYDLRVPIVPVVGEEIINRSFVEKNSEKIDKVYSLIDDNSKKCFENCLKFMFTGELKYNLLSESDKKKYIGSVFDFSNDESYIDIGAYRGETVSEFLTLTDDNYRFIAAVEPDKKSFEKTKSNLAYLNNAVFINAAVTDVDGEVLFSNKAGRQSKILKTNDNKGDMVKAVTVDSAFYCYKPTYIKIDSEGEEINIINGSVKTLSELTPKLNIALYHRSSDFFEIPLLIYKINSSYRLHIAKHPYIPCWDLNLYAVKG